MEARAESGFTSIFNGKNLDGWVLAGRQKDPYLVRDGVLVCPDNVSANLFTEKEYSDFILRFEFKLTPGANNGVGIRAPLEGDAAYAGTEIQILDNDDPKYANLKPFQYHGSVYGIVPAKLGALKKPGEWNTEEISCIGRKVKVTVNGKRIVDTDLNGVHEPEILQQHPGMLRDRGRVGFLGHRSHVEFRNIRIKELSAREENNRPPAGFQALFNGKDLTGWKGLVADPPKRAAMPPSDLAAAQQKADQRMREHWRAMDGVLVFDGKGDSLCAARDYADFELLVDWKIEPGGDSGIYLRGSPQVQIWDRADGSGGLFNNKNNPSKPAVVADRPVGQWNRFRILMTGDKVTVFLNNELVVRNVVMENYWERDKPIYPSGQIELQNHGNSLYFRNIYIREIPR
jgi:hypothetical protein